MKSCTVDGCGRKHVAKGKCQKHYVAERRKANGRQEIPKATPCAQCGAIVHKIPDKRYRRFCDLTCRDLYSIEHGIGAWRPAPPKAPKPKPAPKDMRSPLRRALEDGDHAGVIDAIRSHCDIRPSGCWEWQRKLHRSGYATVAVAGRMHQVHRLTLEARLGKPLGKQAAHHVCANSFCVNPDHLQPVTAAANSAEMLARRYMESRITDLEAALRAVAPAHPLLAEVGIATVGAA